MQMTMKSTLILLLVFITFSLTAQHSYIPTEHTFTTKDGLSSDKIHVLHKGSQGFIWIGTENGLDRFDGQSFKHFNPTNQPQMTINRVQNIIEDEDNYLWLVEDNETFEHAYQSPEINLFNNYTGHWTTLEERFGDDLPFEVDDIRFIQQLTDGSIFIFTRDNHKGYFYSKENDFTAISIPRKVKYISEVLIQKEGTLLVEGGITATKGYNWYIYKMKRNGQIISKRKTDLTIPIQENQQTKYMSLGVVYQVSGGLHLDAYNRFDNKLSYSSTNSSYTLTKLHGIKTNNCFG
jgi:hypothetical protein